MGCIAGAALLVVFVGCFGDLAPQSPQQMTSPGPLFAAHAALDCTSCHVAATAEVDANKCLSCHPVLATQVCASKELHASAVVRAKPCEACHGDHRGAAFDPIRKRTTSAHCGLCHVAPASMQPRAPPFY